MFSVVKCRHCNDDVLHHVAVDIHERVCEDAYTISRRAYGGAASTTANPSPRRDGVVILFWCESCHGLTEMRVYQHHGQTVIEMVAGDTECGHQH